MKIVYEELKRAIEVAELCKESFRDNKETVAYYTGIIEGFRIAMVMVETVIKGEE